MSDRLANLVEKDYPTIAWCIRKKKISVKPMDAQEIESGHHEFLIFDLSVLKQPRLAWAAIVDYGGDQNPDIYWTTISWENWDRQETKSEPARKIPLSVCNNNPDELERYLKDKLNG